MQSLSYNNTVITGGSPAQLARYARERNLLAVGTHPLYLETFHRMHDGILSQFGGGQRHEVPDYRNPRQTRQIVICDAPAQGCAGQYLAYRERVLDFLRAHGTHESVVLLEPYLSREALSAALQAEGLPFAEENILTSGIGAFDPGKLAPNLAGKDGAFVFGMFSNRCVAMTKVIMRRSFKDMIPIHETPELLVTHPERKWKGWEYLKTL